jgi:hypothetical protein
LADASLPSAPRPLRSDQVVRPAGPAEFPNARLTGAGRDDTSRAGVPVSRPGVPVSRPGVPVSRPGIPVNSPGSGTAASAQDAKNPASIQAGTSPVVPGVPQSLSARLGAMLQQSGIPEDASAVFALQALMGEGLGLGAETIKTVRTIALRHAQPRRAAALAARAIAAGLQPDDDGMDAIIRSLSGFAVEDAGREPLRVPARQTGDDSGSETGQDHDRNADRDPDQDAEDHSSQGSSDDGSGQPPQTGQGGHQQGEHPKMVRCECQDETELQKALESAFIELSSSAAADPGFAALARKGPDGRGWLCVPYRFSIDGVDFSGYLRIVFNYASNKVERLVAEIDASGLTRIVDVSWGAVGKTKLRFRPGSIAEGWSFSRVFGQSMEVELLPQGEDPVLIDTVYREVDGHA